MSEQDAEESADAAPKGDDNGLDGLQESNLDSVTGGGNLPEPTMDLQDSHPDTISHGSGDSEDPAMNGDDGSDRQPSE